MNFRAAVAVSAVLMGALSASHAGVVMGASHAPQTTVVINDTILRVGGVALGSTGPWFTGAADSVETTVNRHYFQVNSPGLVSFDILSWEATPPGRPPVTGNPGLSSRPTDVNGDGEIAFFDAMINLYNASTNALVASNDDSSETFEDGSIYDRDSFLSVSLTPGLYFLAVGSYDLSVAEGLARTAFGTGPMTWNGSQYVVADHGDYRLTVIGDVTAVPEPATSALGALALLALAATRRKSAKAAGTVRS